MNDHSIELDNWTEMEGGQKLTTWVCFTLGSLLIMA